MKTHPIWSVLDMVELIEKYGDIEDEEQAFFLGSVPIGSCIGVRDPQTYCKRLKGCEIPGAPSWDKVNAILVGKRFLALRALCTEKLFLPPDRLIPEPRHFPLLETIYNFREAKVLRQRQKVQKQFAEARAWAARHPNYKCPWDK